MYNLKEEDYGLPPKFASSYATQEPLTNLSPHPLGEALAQTHQSYIVAQTQEGLILVDQHAAHERLVYEKMKKELASGRVACEALLIPEVVDISSGPLSTFSKHFSELKKLGLTLEVFGEGPILVREVPCLLKAVDIQKLIQDLADELQEWEDGSDPTPTAALLQKYLDAMCATLACRRSIKGGQALSLLEMNALLRAMEATPHSGQCNHGRPTSVCLNLKDIEKLFGRR